MRVRESIGYGPLAACLLLLGCGDDAGSDPQPEAGHDAGQESVCVAMHGLIAEGSSYESDSGGLQLRLTALTPERPDLGDNRWQFLVRDDAGDPVPDLNVHFSLWMPQHAHGSLKTVVVEDQGDGKYSAEPVNFHMPGYWEVTVKLTDGEDEYAVLLPTCVGE